MIVKQPLACLCFLAALGCGCASNRTQSFKNFFHPPAPRSDALVSAEPPRVDTASSKQSPRVFLNEIHAAARDARSDSVIRDAESHFQAGKKLYLQGDEANARTEFDRAIDLLLSVPDDAPDRAAIESKLDQLVEAIHRYDLSGLGASDAFADPGFEKPPLEDIPQLTFPVDPRVKNKVLEEVKATASQLPLQVNDAVLSFIHYFSSERGRKVLVYGMKRAGRYRPMIQRILDEEGVPQELIYLAQAESGFLPRAVSRMQATGMWQFVLGRGREYGLMQSAYGDDRLDPEKATRAAARHLRDLYHRYGDWYLAMAAYNCGPGNVDKAVERTGYADFWELRRRNALPRETANYVPIILAMTIMAKNPHEYGLEDIEPDSALEFDTVNVTAPTNLLLIADLADCPVSQIRELNPALLRNVAPAGSLVRVPKGTAQVVASAIESVPADRRLGWRAHRVLDGESLSSIARRFAVSEDALSAANQSIASAPESGDLVLIPTAPEDEPFVTGKRTVRYARHRRTASSRIASNRRHGGRAEIASSKHGGRHVKTAPSRTIAKRKSSHGKALQASATRRKPRTLGYTAENVRRSRHIRR